MSATRFRRRPDALWRASLEAVVVLPADEAEPLTLAGTGPEVWALLAEWRTLDDLAEILAAAHGATVSTVAADVGALLDELTAAGAVERRVNGGVAPAG